MAERHAVADLLTDEMRERVRAATFVRANGGVSTVPESPHDWRRCPLAVAVQADTSFRYVVYRALGVSQPHPAVESFMCWADSMDSDPDDVKPMLGVEP